MEYSQHTELINSDDQYKNKSPKELVTGRMKLFKHMICNPQDFSKAYYRRQARNNMYNGRYVNIKLSQIMPLHGLSCKKYTNNVSNRIKILSQTMSDYTNDSIVDYSDINSTSPITIIVNSHNLHKINYEIIYFCVDGNSRLICTKLVADKLEINPYINCAVYDMDNKKIMKKLYKQYKSVGDLCTIINF